MTGYKNIKTDSLRAVAVHGRTGYVMNEIPIGEIGLMLELAFDGQRWTQCYWESETTALVTAQGAYQP